MPISRHSPSPRGADSSHTRKLLPFLASARPGNAHNSRLLPRGIFTAKTRLVVEFMISAIFNQSNYVASKKMLDLTVLRQEALASNLANVETPAYKRLDVAPTFLDQLRSAVAAKDTDRITSIHAHLEVDDQAISSRGDGNTVDMEKEMVELNKNFMAHSMETQLIGGTLKKMRLAITGRAT